MGIEVFQHLRPEVVDGPVAFVGDDNVEGFNRNGRVVVNGLWLFEEPFEAGHGGFFVLVRQLPPLEHGIHALDGADADPRGGIKGIARQTLNDELFRELVVVVRRDILLEFLERLVSQIAAVYQEEHAAGAYKLDEAVDEVDGGEGLAAAGGHLDESTGAILSQRLFKVGDGDDLGRPEAGGDERWHLLEARSQGGIGKSRAFEGNGFSRASI